MSKLRYFISYMKDREVHWYKKLLILFSLLYFAVPTDIVPDFIIGLGWLDDAAVAAFIWNALRSELQGYIAKQQLIDSKVIDLEDKRRSK